MNFTGALAKGFALLAATLFASLAGTLAPAAPAASFSATTVNPAAGSLVSFTDTSAPVPTSWAWDFGDGTSATDRNPGHVYAAAGDFTVRLTVTGAGGSASATLPITVTGASVLRLNAAHSFDLTLLARDPRTGDVGTGRVIGQNDVYGYFSLPSLSGNAGNPELIVKMVDATGIGQNYWVFYGTMTDLEYTLSVKENATGIVKTYSKDDSALSGQFDTTGFANPVTPVPTSGTPTPTPTSTIGSPTPTPTPPSSTTPQTIGIDVARYAFTPGTRSPIEVTAGVTTTLIFSSSDRTHGFSGIPELGIPATNNISAGDPTDPYGGGTNPVDYEVTFTARCPPAAVPMPSSARRRSAAPVMTPWSASFT